MDKTTEKTRYFIHSFTKGYYFLKQNDGFVYRKMTGKNAVLSFYTKNDFLLNPNIIEIYPEELALMDV